MFRRIWEKYIPVIKILLKKAENEPQLLELNKLDFESAGVSKSRTKFKIELLNGNIVNVIHDSQIAVELAHLLMEDDTTSRLLKNKHFVVSLNMKYELKVKELKD